MRVLQLGPYPPPQGGIQTNIAGIRRFLLSAHIPCAVINLTRHRRSNGEADVYYPRGAVQLLQLLLRLRYDIIHLHIGGNLSCRLLALSFLCGLLPWAKTVLTFHSGGYASSRQGRSARAATLRGLTLRRFDRLIAVNQEIVELFKRFGVPRARVRLILPYDLSVKPAELPMPDHLQRFYDSHTPVLLTVGLLEPEYDLPLQIDVLGLIRERFSCAGLAIVGSGSLQDTLTCHIRSKPYADHILLCGDVPHPVTLRAVIESDIFLRTTLYDGDSVSIREALHFGTPVIASDNGLRPDGVDLIPSSDPAALRRAIENRLGRPGRTVARPPGDDGNLRAVLELYREICPDGSLRPWSESATLTSTAKH